MRELYLPEDLHPGQTGQTGPETGQTGPKRPVRVRSCILTQNLIRFRLLMGTDLPTLRRPIEDNPNRFTHLSFTFSCKS
jgi:hypothetical protein